MKRHWLDVEVLMLKIQTPKSNFWTNWTLDQRFEYEAVYLLETNQNKTCSSTKYCSDSGSVFNAESWKPS